MNRFRVLIAVGCVALIVSLTGCGSRNRCCVAKPACPPPGNCCPAPGAVPPPPAPAPTPVGF